MRPLIYWLLCFAYFLLRGSYGSDVMPLFTIRVSVQRAVTRQEFITLRVLAKEKVECVLSPAQWSRGMIPALGAGGPGFKSRLSPYIVLNLKYEKSSLCSHISFLCR